VKRLLWSNIWSLWEAQIHFISVAAGAVVHIRCLYVHNVAAMQTILLKSVSMRYWDVVKLKRVASLAVRDPLLSLSI
jgi:hypothetical protein